MEILINLKNLLFSPRFITWYCNLGFTSLAVFLNMLAENIAEIGLPEWAAVGIGLFFSQVSKALKNRSEGKPLGFARK